MNKDNLKKATTILIRLGASDCIITKEQWENDFQPEDVEFHLIGFEDEDGESIGQQYDTSDAGTIDILAISKDKKTILVIELKKGKAVDTVVGQCLRYMGYVKNEVAEEGQTVSGIIIASEDSKKIRYALSQTSNIDFYTYKIDFQLSKQN